MLISVACSADPALADKKLHERALLLVWPSEVSIASALGWEKDVCDLARTLG